MAVIGHLSDLRPWGLKASPGQQEEFFVGEDVAQDEASRFAFQVNQERDAGHVWIEVVACGCVPEPTTHLHVHCTG